MFSLGLLPLAGVVWVPILSSALAFAAVLLGVCSVGGAWDRVTYRHTADLIPLLKALSLNRSHLDQYLRWWGIALVATFVVVAFVLAMPPISLVAVAMVYTAPRFILMLMIEHRRKLLRDQMVGASVALANSCRAGLSLSQGMDAVSRELADPLASEFRRIVRDYEHGRPLPDAIADVKKSLNVESFTLFAAAILVCLERGGKITETLERISHSLQENQRVEGKLEAETASGKKLVWILAVFPFLFLGLFAVLHPEGTSALLHTLVGQLVLLVILALMWLSVWWSRKILAIEI
jgi:tight adherence protein B